MANSPAQVHAAASVPCMFAVPSEVADTRHVNEAVKWTKMGRTLSLAFLASQPNRRCKLGPYARIRGRRALMQKHWTWRLFVLRQVLCSCRCGHSYRCMCKSVHHRPKLLCRLAEAQSPGAHGIFLLPGPLNFFSSEAGWIPSRRVPLGLGNAVCRPSRSRRGRLSRSGLEFATCSHAQGAAAASGASNSPLLIFGCSSEDWQGFSRQVRQARLQKAVTCHSSDERQSRRRSSSSPCSTRPAKGSNLSASPGLSESRTRRLWRSTTR